MFKNIKTKKFKDIKNIKNIKFKVDCKIKWLSTIENNFIVKIRKKTLFLSSIIENNVFSLCNSQNKSNLQNFNLF